MDSIENDYLTNEYLRVMHQRIAYWKKRFGKGISIDPASDEERNLMVEENLNKNKKASRFYLLH